MNAVASSELAVVVVAYGAPEHLERCLAPLAGRHPLVVIDNSSDQTCARVASAAGAAYVDPGHNLGFAAGVNRAIELLEPGTDVLLLNPDAVIDSPAVARLHEHLRRCGNEHLAAIAPRQRHPADGREQKVLWAFPTPWGTWADALGVGDRIPRWNFLAGSILLLRGTAIREVGRFDERFFLYAEESDWQWRAHLMGWEVELCPEVESFHIGAGTSRDVVAQEVLFHSSAEALLRKWYGRRGWTVARIATVVGALVRAVRDRGEERRSALRRAVLYLRGPRRYAALGRER